VQASVTRGFKYDIIFISFSTFFFRSSSLAEHCAAGLELCAGFVPTQEFLESQTMPTVQAVHKWQILTYQLMCQKKMQMHVCGGVCVCGCVSLLYHVMPIINATVTASKYTDF